MGIVRLQATDGTPVEFDNSKLAGSGGMKDVYFSPDKSYVVAFFRDKQDYNAKDRLENITGRYRDNIFQQAGGDYWKNLYCWPTKIIEYQGKLGLVAPAYHNHFFFEFGSVRNDMLGIKGKDKEGKWFASSKNRKYIDPCEMGDYRSFLRICILISRAVRRMHAAGLAHSDLSYKNVLIDPKGGNACVIDIDGLVVPGKYPPDVLGTPDFIAPEVMATIHLNKSDPKRCLPRRETDLHALAVLVYMYLLYRHPLRGRKIHDPDDAERDEALSMGEKALFVENPHDRSNRVDYKWLERNYDKKLSEYLPWVDVDKLPYTTTGPYLKALFDKVFIDGLHNPSLRPTAGEWEEALVKTNDLVQPCHNSGCTQKWFIFDNSTAPKCPFCGTKYKGLLPVLNLYSSRGSNKFMPDNHRLMVYNNQYIYRWHSSRHFFPNEKLSNEEKKPVGYFVFHRGKWLLINQKLDSMKDVTAGVNVPVNSSVQLEEGKQILLSAEDGGRLLQVQMVCGS